LRDFNRQSSAVLDYKARVFTFLILILVAVSIPACNGIDATQALPQSAKLSQEQIANLISNPDRSIEDRKADARRKPQELLTFIGIRPGLNVLDISAGGGYTTELIARAVGPSGHVYGQSAPVENTTKSDIVVDSKPDKVRLSSPESLAIRVNYAGLSNISPLVVPFENPVPSDSADGSFDLVTFIYNYHDLGHMGVDRIAMNKHIFNALKHGGLYIIADHAGRAGTGISESSTLHRIEEKFLIQEVTSVGFRLESSGNFLHNPLDPRDQNTPLAGQMKDGFILKFIKP
jgi:predicted methyltransferase